MAVDGLVGNTSYFDDDVSNEFEPLSCQDATNENSKSGILTTRSSELSNSERTLEKWEYLLRTRPRDPMYNIISLWSYQVMWSDLDFFLKGILLERNDLLV